MNQKFKPEKFNSVSPYLLVKDLTKTINFLAKIFNANIVHQHERNEKVVHVSIKIDDSIVMLGQVDADESLVSCHIHVYVPNVNEVFDKAIAQSCTVIQPLAKRDDGDTRGGFKDFNGTVWWIGNQS